MTITEFAAWVIAMSLLRFVLSGIVNSRVKNVPCVFGMFSQGLIDQNRRKLHENMWYTLWHFTRIMFAKASYHDDLFARLFRITILIFSFSLGIYYISRQSWVRDLVMEGRIQAILEGYPQTAESMGCETYYLVELVFWVSCLLFLFFETRRKDIVEMTIHHTTTILLVSLSYLFGFGRPGILVMSLHDLGDIFLYSAKSCQYRKWHKLADILFAVFAVVFYASRILFFPRFVIYPLVRVLSSKGMFQPDDMRMHNVVVFLTCLLCVLFCLHIMWGTTIAKMVKRSLTNKKSVADEGDPRSDEEKVDAHKAVEGTNSSNKLKHDSAIHKRK